MPRSQLKIAVVTDIHHGAISKTKIGPALGLLNNFVNFANEWDADIVVDPGDRISDRDNGDRSGADGGCCWRVPASGSSAVIYWAIMIWNS